MYKTNVARINNGRRPIREMLVSKPCLDPLLSYKKDLSLSLPVIIVVLLAILDQTLLSLVSTRIHI